MLLGFRTGNTPSPFKQHLIDNGLNANIKIRGPFGPFKLKDDAKPVVLFASGVGITPILSILKSVEKDQTREIHVVYASAQFYLFKDEIESIAKENPKIHVIYTQSIEETQGKLTALALQYKNEAYYYSSGAGNVIQDTKALLTSRGIEKNNMIDDYFMGY